MKPVKGDLYFLKKLSITINLNSKMNVDDGIKRDDQTVL